VLTRLLELNKERAEQEALAGAAGKPKRGGGRPRDGRPKLLGYSDVFRLVTITTVEMREGTR